MMTIEDATRIIQRYVDFEEMAVDDDQVANDEEVEDALRRVGYTVSDADRKGVCDCRRCRANQYILRMGRTPEPPEPPEMEEYDDVESLRTG